MTLHRLTIFPCLLLILSLAPTAQAQSGLNEGYSEPTWSLNLNATPHAALIEDDVFFMARLTESDVAVTTASLERGRLLFTEGRDTAVTAPLERVAPGADKLFAAGGSWAAVSSTSGKITLLDAELDLVREHGRPLASFDAPFPEVERLIEYNGMLMALGHTSEGLALAVRPLYEQTDAEWETRLVDPEGRTGAALVATHNGVRIIGGEIAGDERTVTPQFPLVVQLDEDGRIASVEDDALPMYRGIGRAAGAEANNLIVVFPETQAYRGIEPLDRQTLLMATDRIDGFLTPWREAEVGVPRLRDVIVVGDPVMHEILVLGGTLADSGEPNTRIYGFHMPPTDTIHRMARTIVEQQNFEARRMTERGFSSALDEAQNKQRFHVVFILDDDEKSEELMMTVQLSRDMRLMLEDAILSETQTDEERDQAIEKAGSPSVPAIALLNHDGFVVGVHEGTPSRQEMFDLLRPMWNPPGF